MHLLDLTDDILLAVIEEIPTNSIKSLRQTCIHLRDLTRLRSVWLRICTSRVIEKKIPFPNEPIDDLPVDELERRTCHALRLQAAWTSERPKPYRYYSFKATPVNALADVRFLIRDGIERLLTLSEGIWPVIECWDLTTIRDGGMPERVGEWPRSGGRISNLVVNSNSRSTAALAFSVSRNGVSTVHIKSILKPLEADSRVTFEDVRKVHTTYRPVSLEGNLLVLSNERAEIQILDWQTGNIGVLQNDEWNEDDGPIHRCLQVFFAHDCILVARARSLAMFPMVELRPPGQETARVTKLTSHSFGWIDGITIAFSSEPNDYPYSPVTMLLRAENSDPWASDIHTIIRYVLIPNVNYQALSSDEPQTHLPYLFPPQILASIPSQRGFLRCPHIVLGRAGTALWVHPRVYTRLRPADPLDHEVSSVQMLCCTVFRGPLAEDDPYAKDPWTDEPLTLPNGAMLVRNNTLWKSINSIWTTVSYDEEHGLIALGSHDGQVTVLYMA